MTPSDTTAVIRRKHQRNTLPGHPLDLDDDLTDGEALELEGFNAGVEAAARLLAKHRDASPALIRNLKRKTVR
jgi:hypothetical protein